VTQKILFVSFDTVPGIGAVGQQLGKLIPALSERLEVDALSLKEGELAHIQRLGQSRMMRVPTPEENSPERVASFQRAVTRQLDSDTYDCIFCTDLFSAHSVVTHDPAPDAPLVIELFDLPSVSYDERYDFFAGDASLQQELQRDEDLALTASARIITHSATMQRALLDRGVSASKIAHLPFGVDVSLFAPPSIEVRAEPNAFLVAAVVEPCRRPQLESLLSALAKAPRRVQLVLVGDRVDKELMVSVADSLGLQRRVRNEPATTVEQLATALGNVDVVLALWGYTEATLDTGLIPVEMLDALACGRPVVATDCAVTREVLAKSEAGLRCQAGDAAALTKALTELEGSSALRKRLGTRGMELVHDRYSWERVGPRLMQIVDEVLKRKSPGEILTADAAPDPEPPESELPEQELPEDPEDLIHTPIVPRPPDPVVPAPVALGVTDELDGSGAPADPWAHDTIATPTQFDEEPPPPSGTPGAIPGLRSVAIMDDVPVKSIHDEETEIRTRDPSQTLGANEETERLIVDRGLVNRLKSEPALPRSLVDEEETVRMPAFSDPEPTVRTVQGYGSSQEPPPAGPDDAEADDQGDPAPPRRGSGPRKKR